MTEVQLDHDLDAMDLESGDKIEDLGITVNIIPSTPNAAFPAATQLQLSNVDAIEETEHLHPSSVTSHDFGRKDQTRPASLGEPSALAVPSLHRKEFSQERTLAALSIGAPLIASVVVACLSVVRDELAGAYGDDPRGRPGTAQATIALMWSAVVTSLGSTMISVAGLAMSAGYHDSHVGVTKMIVRRIRSWRRSRQHKAATNTAITAQTRGMSPAPSALTACTEERRVQHNVAALRAAEVSARLLGVSVAILAASLITHLFTLYPRGVAVSVLSVGLATSLVTCIPLLPVVFPSTFAASV